MKNRTTKNEFWYYRVGNGKQTDYYWERRVLVVLRNQSDTAVTRNTFLGFVPKLLARDSSWCTVLCEFLGKNYWAGRTGEKGQKSKYEKAVRWTRDLLGGHGCLAGQGAHTLTPHPNFCSMMRIFIPLPTFFTSVPGKDEVLMRWIFVLPVQSCVTQLKGVHHHSRQEVFSSIQPLLYHNPPQNEFSLSPALFETQQMQLWGGRGHSWAQLGIPRCQHQHMPLTTCQHVQWFLLLPKPFHFFICLPWPCFHILSLLFLSRFNDQVKFTHHAKRKILGEQDLISNTCFSNLPGACLSLEQSTISRVISHHRAAAPPPARSNTSSFLQTLPSTFRSGVSSQHNPGQLSHHSRWSSKALAALINFPPMGLGGILQLWLSLKRQAMRFFFF